MYCVRCKKSTSNGGAVTHNKTKNGKTMAASTCAVCGTKKRQFVSAKGAGGKETKGAGAVGDFFSSIF